MALAHQGCSVLLPLSYGFREHRWMMETSACMCWRLHQPVHQYCTMYRKRGKTWTLKAKVLSPLWTKVLFKHWHKTTTSGFCNWDLLPRDSKNKWQASWKGCLHVWKFLGFCFVLFLVFGFFFWIGFPKLSGLTSNSQSSCLSIWSVGITNVNHNAGTECNFVAWNATF